MLSFIYNTFESFITTNIPEVKNFLLFEEDGDEDLNKDPVARPNIEFEILDFEPINFGNKYQQWVGEVKLHINVDVYGDLKTGASLQAKSFNYFNIMNDIYTTLNGLSSWDLPEELRSDKYQINDIVRNTITYPKNTGNIKTGEVIFQIVLEDYSNVPEQEIIVIDNINVDINLVKELGDLTVTSTQEEIDTNTAYTFYNVTVVGTGGVEPYTGDGVKSVNTGYHEFTVVDSLGASATTSVTVTAPSTAPYYALYAQSGSFDPDSPIYDEIRLSPLGIYLYKDQTYYINWGDGNDEIYTPIATDFYNDHSYTTDGVKYIEYIAIENNIQVPIEQFRVLTSGIIDLRMFLNNPLLTTWVNINFTTAIYGDLANFKLTSETSPRKLISFLNYNNYVSYVYGDLANLKYYDFSIRLSANDVYGDIVDLINQDMDEININFQIGAKYDCTAIDTGYTEDKSISFIRLYSPNFDQSQINNLVLQVAQNQTYVGGSLVVAGTQGSPLDLTDPDVLAAYNFLISLGWTITMITNP